MATIQKRVGRHGEVSYRVQIRHRGQPVQTATFVTHKDAQDWAAQQEGRRIDRLHFPNRIARQYTLAHAIDRYLQEELHKHSPGTQRLKVLHLAWWRQELGAVSLANLTLDMFVAKRALLHIGRSAYTVNNYCTNISAVLSCIVHPWGWLEHRPLHRGWKLKAPQGRTRFLTTSERDRLLAVCHAHTSPYIYPIVVLALGTGGRRQELTDLPWSAVDLERRRINFLVTKNGESRSVPLTGLAWTVLYQWWQQGLSTEYVFPGLDGPWARSTFWDNWNTVRRKAGLKNFRFHDLRHTFASYLAMNGATLLDIAHLLGHKQLKQVQRYAHLTEDHTRTVVERMTERFLVGAQF